VVCPAWFEGDEDTSSGGVHPCNLFLEIRGQHQWCQTSRRYRHQQEDRGRDEETGRQFVVWEDSDQQGAPYFSKGEITMIVSPYILPIRHFLFWFMIPRSSAYVFMWSPMSSLKTGVFLKTGGISANFPFKWSGTSRSTSKAPNMRSSITARNS
jgi:hypothetical protein